MTVFDILTLIFGISLFLFGMNLMGDTLKRSVGNRLKLFLGRLTAKPFRGFLLGALVTAVIQSSSATTVLVVGFVNSGTMLLSQAIGVIMGANVGTSVTSWITALSGLEGGGAIGSLLRWFKPSVFTPVVALIGLLLYLLGKNDRKKSIGLILLGFSVLMIGMDTMSDAVAGFGQNETFRSILLLFENPILGLLAGMVLTAIVQSSSASIGILQSFTVTGAITFGSAVPIIMGQNIGTCVTALIASVGANKNAKRASVIHLLFNVFGAVFGLGFFYLLKNRIGIETLGGPIDMWGIAVVHTVFNILTALILLPLGKQLERLATTLVRDEKSKESFHMLDERLLNFPSVALERSRRMTLTMAQTAMHAMDISCQMLRGRYSTVASDAVKKDEITADELEDKLGSYLIRISEKDILDIESREVNRLLHLLSDFERISDHAVHIASAAEELGDKKLSFSVSAQEELLIFVSAIEEITHLSLSAFENNDYEQASMVEPLEQVIDNLKNEMRRRHILRLQKNLCTIEQGFVFTDILTDLERVADHCSNIAGCLMEFSESNSLELHRYLKEYRMDRDVFATKRRLYEKKYCLPQEK